MASNMATSLSSVLPGTLVSLLQKFCTSSLQVYQNNAPVGLTHYIFIDTKTKIPPSKYNLANDLQRGITQFLYFNSKLLVQIFWFGNATAFNLKCCWLRNKTLTCFWLLQGFFYQSMYKFHIIILIPTSSDVVWHSNESGPQMKLAISINWITHGHTCTAYPHLPVLSADFLLFVA